MTRMIQDRVLDFGLIDSKNLADKIYLVTQDPATYTEAISTYPGGNKNFGPGNALTGPFAGTTPTGRKLTTAAITDGDITASVTVSGWAVVDSVNARLLMNGGLNASQAVVSGNKFTLGAFDIKVANQ